MFKCVGYNTQPSQQRLVPSKVLAETAMQSYASVSSVPAVACAFSETASGSGAAARASSGISNERGPETGKYRLSLAPLPSYVDCRSLARPFRMWKSAEIKSRSIGEE